MAGVVDRIRRRNRMQQPQRDWTSTGSFISKPARGWLHPDHQLAPDAGVSYAVRYIGCMEVKQSMKTLDFDTRTAVAKESISKVCEVAGLKNATKKPKKSGKVTKLLRDEPDLEDAGSDVNLTVTTDMLSMMIMDSGEILANHQMPGISFASGGDADTMDFVAYVAKDELKGRCCFVLECGGGLAQDVITTIGQAFEIRFKQYLSAQPQATILPDSENFGNDAWGNDGEYYNDRVGAKPPSPLPGELPPEYTSPKNMMVSDGIREPKVGLLIDLSEESNAYDNSPQTAVQYDNHAALATATNGVNVGGTTYYDNPKGLSRSSSTGSKDSGKWDQQQNASDAFNMKPITVNLPREMPGKEQVVEKIHDNSPYHEEWFHGPLDRGQTEALLRKDGDFLVRESTRSTGQYVLSGMHDGRVRHLLLVDPQGVVRTRDRTFNSVSHLINYHMENKLPIISQESELILRRPVTQPHKVL